MDKQRMADAVDHISKYLTEKQVTYNESYYILEAILEAIKSNIEADVIKYLGSDAVSAEEKAEYVVDILDQMEANGEFDSMTDDEKEIERQMLGMRLRDGVMVHDND